MLGTNNSLNQYSVDNLEVDEILVGQKQLSNIFSMRKRVCVPSRVSQSMLIPYHYDQAAAVTSDQTSVVEASGS